LRARWIEPDVRDEIVDFIEHVAEYSDMSRKEVLSISSLKNSEDAVSVAEEVALNQHFRNFITREEIDLGDLLDDLCYSEVEMLEDEDHIGAVLSDMVRIK
jgi:hypothetical protein